MKRLFLTLVPIMLCSTLLMANENANNPSMDIASVQENKKQPEVYRRSSLCILLVTHQGTQYAADMERQFLKMKWPERYNDHNIQLRVIHTDKSLKAKNIANLLKQNEVGKQLVAKWFNRDPYTGKMNMNLIHNRGGYNASMSDAERADLTVRGRAILQEEGVDLIQNTFVLVCDMQYKKRDDAGAWAAIGTALLAGGLQAMANSQGYGESIKKSTQQLTEVGVELGKELSGFSVIMDAHLLQLNWTNKDLDKLYSNYWIDDTTPATESQSHKQAFDNDRNSFQLEYLGHYKSRSTKIEMQSSSTFDDVILEVTEKTVNKSIKELALIFPQFKPKTPLINNNGQLMAYVGTKENITNKSKFDVLEAKKKNKQIVYNKVGKLKVEPGTVWDNRNIRMDEISDLSSVKGTSLKGKTKKKYYEEPYMLVESGKSRLYGMKEFTFDVGVSFGSYDFSDDALYEIVKKDLSSKYHKNIIRSSIRQVGSGFSFNMIDLGCTWNLNRNLGWNILQLRLGLGGTMGFAFNTGITLRTNPMKKNKDWSLFIMPQVGYNLCFITPNVEYQWVKHSTNKTIGVSYNFFDYGAIAGVNYKKFSLGFRYGAQQYKGITLTFHL